MNRNEYNLLESFIIDNPDLNLLESKLSSFNIFEAVGMARQEIRHSYFLSFLLNPSEAHYFGDLFLKKLLITALLSFETPPFSAIEIDIANLEDAEVKREYKNIDILIYSSSEKIVVAIENKVDSSEHSNQLCRYRKIIETDFSGYQKILIYLTKEGDIASDPENWYSLSYETIARCLDDMCIQHSAKMNNDVQSLMIHYSTLIKRHIMSDSEIAQLCRKIYKQHRQAIDLIYEHRPDFQLEISDYLQQLIEENQDKEIEKDDCSKKHPRFSPKEWDRLEFQKTGDNWTDSKRILLFEFWNDPEYLGLNLCIGPCDEKIKQLIYKEVKSLEISGIHNYKGQLSGSNFHYIVRIPILTQRDYEEGDFDKVKEKIKFKFEACLRDEVAKIRAMIMTITPNMISNLNAPETAS
jgi:hypothetical protein